MWGYDIATYLGSSCAGCWELSERMVGGVAGSEGGPPLRHLGHGGVPIAD